MRGYAACLFLAIAGLGAAGVARAEGKCNDDPVKKGPNGELVVGWMLPEPKGATVHPTGVGQDPFAEVDAQITSCQVAGAPVDCAKPRGYPFTAEPTPVALFATGAKVFRVEPALNEWSKFAHPGADMPPGARAAMRRELGAGNEIRSVYVEHPAVDPAEGQSVCNCALQRGVVVWDRGREDLFVRSTFYTEKPTGADPRLFVPRQGWEISFARPSSLWFPVRLNSLLRYADPAHPRPEDGAWAVVDVLTPARVGSDCTFAPFTRVAETSGPTVAFRGKKYWAVRLHAAFTPGQDLQDVSCALPTRIRNARAAKAPAPKAK